MDAGLLPGFSLGGGDGVLSGLQPAARHQPHARVLLARHQQHLPYTYTPHVTTVHPPGGAAVIGTRREGDEEE